MRRRTQCSAGGRLVHSTRKARLPPRLGAKITVFLAAVLFLVGIGSTFKLHTVRYTLIGVGSVLLILATVLILQQPGLPS